MEKFQKIIKLPNIVPLASEGIERQIAPFCVAAYSAAQQGDNLDEISETYRISTGSFHLDRESDLRKIKHDNEARLNYLEDILSCTIEERATVLYKTQCFDDFKKGMAELNTNLEKDQIEFRQLQTSYVETSIQRESLLHRSPEPIYKSFLDNRVIFFIITAFSIVIETHFLGSAIGLSGIFKTWLPAYVLGFFLSVILAILIDIFTENQNEK